MHFDSISTRGAVTALLCLAVYGPAQAADARDADIAAMKRAINELRAQNSELASRLATLEIEKSVKDAAPPRIADSAALRPPEPEADTEGLARRVKELEMAKTAQEDATRAIIRESVSTLGSKINEAVSFSGAVEMIAGRGKDFSGASKSTLHFNTAELEFDIQANPWATARLVLEYVDGTNLLFPSTRGFDAGIDRFGLDTAEITIGDVQRFPLYVKTGRMNLAFGSSTGVHRSDVLSIESPLTIEAFEMRRNAVGVGFGLPTPALTRPALPVVVPPVRSLVLGPLVGAFGRQLGYAPPPPVRAKPPTAVNLPPESPPFFGSVFLYEGHNIGAQRSFTRNLNARLGYRAGGHCGRRYSELRSTDLCPWALDFSVDYIGSVFDSRFLEAEYRPFLNQFGPVRGMASTVKLSLGPVLLAGEWNGAIDRAVFNDDLGTRLSIKPRAWQVSLGYQFDWNPWVETIGGQGTYVSVGYSRSTDLAGATQLIGTERLRVGSLPRSRWMLTAGEWVLEGLKVQLEYSRTTDYSTSDGGTGTSGNGIQMTLTYAW